MTKIVFAGYGGQGILTLGQIVANIAMNQDKEVTWMPSYGAEMRGGTANCAVVISDKVIGSPMVRSQIDILVAMNPPSLDKFLKQVKPGGQIYVNTSLIKDKIIREDIQIVEIDASSIAQQVGNMRVANMVMLSGFLKKTDLFTIEDVQQVLDKTFKSRKPELIPLNLKAIEEGLKALE